MLFRSAEAGIVYPFAEAEDKTEEERWQAHKDVKRTDVEVIDEVAQVQATEPGRNEARREREEGLADTEVGVFIGIDGRHRHLANSGACIVHLYRGSCSYRLS